jgi:hypothetical protein
MKSDQSPTRVRRESDESPMGFLQKMAVFCGFLRGSPTSPIYRESDESDESEGIGLLSD